MDTQTYREYREQVEFEQQAKDYGQIRDEMSKKSEFMLEMDSLPKQNHVWVDRGAVMSCEGAAHANHHVYKRTMR